jgi:hypothetical protein
MRTRFVTGELATNDLDRIARAAGITRIFVGSGVHVNAMGIRRPDADLFQMDEAAAADVMQRHPGLQIDVLDQANPVHRRLFEQLQETATTGTPYGPLPRSGFATLAAHCYSARCAPQGPPGEPTLTYFNDVEFRTVVDVPEGAVSVHYALCGVQIASGALSIYGGMREKNDALAALGITVGASQVAGGASWIYGVKSGSAPAISFASKANLLGSYLTAPITLYQVHRDVGAPGEHANRSWQENAFTAVVDVGKLAGIFYPPAAFAAMGSEYVLKPVAQEVSEYATPKFIGGMSQAYGIPEQYLWSMH